MDGDFIERNLWDKLASFVHIGKIMWRLTFKNGKCDKWTVHLWLEGSQERPKRCQGTQLTNLS